ncbi:MAG TPA: polysaccharide pyruvyl transferase family protein [Brevibacterium senegalense]|uniref:Polysaccharide pyruvyl transferase family protein n=1 Tax=Brevibacterium senegalense TaxID=1033736 RepID=A0A921MG19_9MICO|nr:polysaccharide pyruvyl transferase family protein [Brevibacterium senegalense]
MTSTGRILIRATPSPLDDVDPGEAWRLNAFHNNSGNVAFPFGLFRNLMSDTTAVDSDWYGARLPEPEEVNEQYDAYILPMANDFGGHFKGEMTRMTRFIERLTIPVVVVGIGGAFALDDTFDSPKPFDSVAKRFVEAVLERSSLIGLRGEITGRYLESLGFTEDRHFRVIGDPTLYNLGRELSIRPFEYRPDLKIAYNMTPKAPQEALAFLTKLPESFPDATYIPQDFGDFSKLYSGMVDVTANPFRDTVDNYPNSLAHTPFRTGNLRFYLDAPSWISDMREFDLSIGTRIHGNILPTHAGTPSLTLMYGSRLTELADYHHLPRMFAADVDPDARLADLVEGVDFHEPERYHAENFDRYVSFLDENAITHSYREAETELPFDRRLSERQLPGPIAPITALSDLDEIRERLTVGHDIAREKTVNQKDAIKRLRSEIAKLKDEKKDLQAQRDAAQKKARAAERLAASRTPRGMAGRAKRLVKRVGSQAASRLRR